ncbi:MAG: aminotransferase class III-fold pyridoxal phosphate-dependent enzyme [Oligoflexia bacterium]|nr:aminotransferase class III-fold pyridoxal phosphate-dependent enzyme [Oligoflexia bacterium]
MAVVHPGSICTQMMDELKHYFIEEPNPFAIDVEKCKGMWLHTLDGDLVFDWCCIYGSKLLGFNHPRMRDPQYVEKLITAANNKLSNPYYLTKDSLSYYRLIHELMPKSMLPYKQSVRILTTNSGAEAMENMMKYFMTLHRNRLLSAGKSVNCRRFVYFEQGFHGRTGFAVNATEAQQDPIITRDYKGLLAGNLVVPFPAIDNSSTGNVHSKNLERMHSALEHIEFVLKAYGDEIVGMMIEPIQSSGGQRIALKEFYQKLSELCHRHHVYLGFDEVQTAGGQTGAFFCSDLFDLPHAPEAVATSKKLGHGVLYMKNSLQESGALDSTWCGSYVDMIRFMQEWKIVLDEQLVEQVPKKSAYFVAKLQGLTERYPKLLSNIRGYGLYQGFSLPNAQVKSELFHLALQKENLFLFPAGINSIRFRPTLDVSISDIDELIVRLDRVLPLL